MYVRVCVCAEIKEDLNEKLKHSPPLTGHERTISNPEV